MVETSVVEAMAFNSKGHRLERIKVFRQEIPSKNLKEVNARFYSMTIHQKDCPIM